MGQILVYLVPAVIALGIFGVFVRLSMPKQDAVSIEERLQTFAERPRTLEEIADYWDNHSVSDHWEQTHEVEFEIRANHRHRVTLDPDVYSRLEAQAHARGDDGGATEPPLS